MTMLHLKTDVANLYNGREELLEKQAHLRETIKIQKAELAFLTSPVRLERFANMAGMVPIDSRQIYPVSVIYEADR